MAARRISRGRRSLPRSTIKPGPTTSTCARTPKACTPNAGAMRTVADVSSTRCAIRRPTGSSRPTSTGEPGRKPRGRGKRAMSAWRTPSGGRIDRSQRLRFRFDGRAFEGVAGDTLASALLANGVHLVGRSFKYHRPRGILAAGAEEPNALVTVRRDGGAHDAQPARDAGRALRRAGGDEPEPLAEPRDSMSAASTTGCRRSFRPASTTRPSCGRKRAWKALYEPVIRRAAGLGVAPTRSGPGSLRAVLCALRRAGRRRGSGGLRRRAGGRGRRRARDPVRRTERIRRHAARRPRRADRRPRRRRLGRACDGIARREPPGHPAAAHDGVRLFSAEPHRPQRTLDRSSGLPRPGPAARAALAGARALGRARDGRDRAAARVPGQRPPRHHAGGRRADVFESLRRARRRTRGARDRRRRGLSRRARSACGGRRDRGDRRSAHGRRRSPARGRARGRASTS